MSKIISKDGLKRKLTLENLEKLGEVKVVIKNKRETFKGKDLQKILVNSLGNKSERTMEDILKNRLKLSGSNYNLSRRKDIMKIVGNIDNKKILAAEKKAREVRAKRNMAIDSPGIVDPLKKRTSYVKGTAERVVRAGAINKTSLASKAIQAGGISATGNVTPGFANSNSIKPASGPGSAPASGQASPPPLGGLNNFNNFK
jgi:hypothetical protein